MSAYEGHAFLGKRRRIGLGKLDQLAVGIHPEMVSWMLGPTRSVFFAQIISNASAIP